VHDDVRHRLRDAKLYRFDGRLRHPNLPGEVDDGGPCQADRLGPGRVYLRETPIGVCREAVCHG
jgi:hypothetical protein